MMSPTADAIYGVPTVGYEDALFTVGTAYMLSVFGRAPHRRPYGGIRMIAVKADRVVHCSSIPAFPFGGPSARENVQWTFSSEDGPVRPMDVGSAKPRRKRSPVVLHVKGGLPTGTIERARLAAMWAAGEVPGSEGNPPEKRVPRFS